MGGLGTGAPSGLGNVLRSFNGWISENGTPNFRINFTNGATGSLSMLFLGIAAGYTTTSFRPGFDVYDASNNLLGIARVSNASTTSAQNLSVTFSGTAAYAIVVPGTFNDWVAVDNITFTNIPTPGSLALLGLAGIAAPSPSLSRIGPERPVSNGVSSRTPGSRRACVFALGARGRSSTFHRTKLKNQARPV